MIGRPVALFHPTGHVGDEVWLTRHPCVFRLPQSLCRCRICSRRPTTPRRPLLPRWIRRENEHYHNPWRQRWEERCTIGTMIIACGLRCPNVIVRERRVSFARYESRGFRFFREQRVVMSDQWPELIRILGEEECASEIWGRLYCTISTCARQLEIIGTDDEGLLFCNVYSFYIFFFYFLRLL